MRDSRPRGLRHPWCAAWRPQASGRLPPAAQKMDPLLGPSFGSPWPSPWPPWASIGRLLGPKWRPKELQNGVQKLARRIGENCALAQARAHLSLSRGGSKMVRFQIPSWAPPPQPSCGSIWPHPCPLRAAMVSKWAPMGSPK